METYKYLPKEIVDKICYYEPLAQWFSKNQFSLSRFELTFKGCLHMEENSHHDVKILGRMANAAYTYLEDETVKSKIDRAYNAAVAIKEIYEKEKENLSNDAKNALYIDTSKKKMGYLPNNLTEKVSQYPPLEEWFCKNQFRISYFNLTFKGCLLNESHIHYDIIVLSKMANAAHICLEDKTVESEEERAYNAAIAIKEIYEMEKENLNNDAKNALYIDLGESKKKTK